MKRTGIFRACVLAMVLGLGVLPGTTAAVEPVVQVNGDDWRNPSRVLKRLADRLVKECPGTSKKKMRAFIQNEANLNLLLNFYMAWAEAGSGAEYKAYREQVGKWVAEKEKQIQNYKKTADACPGPEGEQARFRHGRAVADLKNLKAEAKCPVSLAEVLQDRKAEALYQRICRDNKWLEQILFSGELVKPGRVLGIMAAVAGKDAKAMNQRVPRETATATALEYARNNWSTGDAVNRADYFIRNWRDDRLNTVYTNLNFWLRRVVCGWKNNHSSGTVKAFEWALRNVHLPDWQYPASCWRCGYILDNVFGDSIHTDWYAAPFVGVYDDNHMIFTQNVGGVCGGLSHFGAASACANGVPALTNGEPGHCAYIVNIQGKWTPAYSLSWERGLHWIPWSNNWTYSALHLTSDLNGKAQAESKRLSNAFRAMAYAYQEAGAVDKALRCIENAAEAEPLNYPVWREYAAFLNRHKPQDVARWEELNNKLCKGLGDKYPEQAAELLKQYVYGPLAKAGASAEVLGRCFACFWKHASVLGPDRWYIENLANQQLNMYKDARKGDAEAATSELYTAVLAAAAPHDAYSGPIMAWGNNLAAGMSPEGNTRLVAAMTKALSGGGVLSKEQRTRLLGNILITAEKNRDASTFHAIAKLLDPALVKADFEMPAMSDFPGKLVSEGGMVFASSTSQWDQPHTHPGLLTKRGGKIHTGKDTNAWIAVKLPKHAYINGVDFAGTNEWSLIGRFRPIQVQISDTGKDDDWHDVGEVIPNTGHFINRFDLRKERPKALFIRVLRKGGPEFFHANGIYVYGEPAA